MVWRCVLGHSINLMVGWWTPFSGAPLPVRSTHGAPHHYTPGLITWRWLCCVCVYSMSQWGPSVCVCSVGSGVWSRVACRPGLDRLHGRPTGRLPRHWSRLRQVRLMSPAEIHTHTRTRARERAFNGLFSGTTQVSRYQKGKNQSGLYWSKRQRVAAAAAGQYASLHLAPDRKPCQHHTTQFFTGRMPFLLPNQQCQSTEGNTCRDRYLNQHIYAVRVACGEGVEILL